MWPSSLKARLTIVILLSSAIPLLLIGIISSYAIDNVESNVRDGVISTLKQVRIDTEKTLEMLDFASRQFVTINGTVGGGLRELFEAERNNTYFEFFRETNKVRERFTLVGFTNPNVGVMFYHMPDQDKIMFENRTIGTDFQPDRMPMLTDRKVYQNFGPHPTVSQGQDALVLSIYREVEQIDSKPVYIYIETHLDLLKELFRRDKYGVDTIHILTDAAGQVMYSDDRERYPTGSLQPRFLKEAASDDHYDFYYEKSRQGWQVIAGVHKAGFNQAKTGWTIRYALVGIFTLAVSLLLGWAIWRTVYRPLIQFSREIKAMGTNIHHELSDQDRMAEFNVLFVQFDQMRRQVLELFLEVERKERRKQELEVEKLLVQINPHFLHNTLNTIQWLARMQGNDDIDKLVSVFTRVLHYNLGKEGGIVKIKEEVQALEDYVSLQRIRYDYEFDVRIIVTAETLEVPIPRFVLQPLVENALYHGLRDEGGMIEVHIRHSRNDMVEVTVRDNGAGMSEETKARLLLPDTGERRKSGLGIGLRFVDRMMKMHYGEAFGLQVESELGEGTTMRLRIPTGEGKLEQPQGGEQHD
ncbi:hypothetical protein SY83_10225 [Paenibacillus swuensis]|uniref:histidine kinase n=2 Tax=Paenibacillus swuensis TaxID=1178515 RepID=A0A172TQ01_9BACL|nr:hypothetical protein SY83_10225 [Paenibacillus swuensis]